MTFCIGGMVRESRTSTSGEGGVRVCVCVVCCGAVLGWCLLLGGQLSIPFRTLCLCSIRCNTSSWLRFRFLFWHLPYYLDLFTCYGVHGLCFFLVYRKMGGVGLFGKQALIHLSHSLSIFLLSCRFSLSRYYATPFLNPNSDGMPDVCTIVPTLNLPYLTYHLQMIANRQRKKAKYYRTAYTQPVIL